MSPQADDASLDEGRFSAPTDHYSSPRRRLITELQGKSFRMPDLTSLVEHWPGGLNPDLDWLRDEVKVHLTSVVLGDKPNAGRLKKFHKLLAADFGLSGAAWYPWSSRRVLKTMTFMVIWLFLWDDEIDEEEGYFGLQFDKAQKYRQETLEFLRKCLIQTNSESGSNEFHPFILSFAPIAKELREHSTQAQCQRLFKEFEKYISASEEEQRRRLSDKLVSPEDYMSLRMGTSAVGIQLALLEYCEGIFLEPEVLDDKNLHIMWNQANVIISLHNDIISLKKELAAGSCDSLVPLLYLRASSLQDAIDKTNYMIVQAKNAFDIAAERLENHFQYDADQLHATKAWIAACRANCTGNLYWHLRSGRYGVQTSNMSLQPIVFL